MKIAFQTGDSALNTAYTRQRTVVLMAMIALVCVCIPSCQTPAPPPEPIAERPEPVIKVVSYDERLRYVLHKTIQVMEARPMWTEDGRMKVQLDMINRNAMPVQLQFQAAFKDESGSLIADDTTQWRTLAMNGNGDIRTYEVIAFSKNAKKVEVRVRLAG